MPSNGRKTRNFVLVLLVLIVTACSWYRPITELATESVDAGLKRSLISFASARALNGVISALQGTEIAAQPFGVGVSLSVGEILDPINDLVESLSSIMLMASVAFGIEKLLLTMGSNWTVSAFVTIVALLWSALLLWREAPRWLTRLMLALLFVRFVMPVTMIGSAHVFEQFSADDYQQSQAVLDSTSIALQGLAAKDAGERADPAPGSRPEETAPPLTPPESKGSGFFDWAGSALAAARDKASDSLVNLKAPTVSVREQYERLKATAENAAERMIRLIVVFLMQTVVMPLVLLWGLYRLTVALPITGSNHAHRADGLLAGR